MRRLLATLIALVAACLSATLGYAECPRSTALGFHLFPGQVVPASSSSGSGIGFALLCLDDGRLSGLVLITLGETVTAVHVHGPADFGSSGPALFDLPLPINNRINFDVGPVTTAQVRFFEAQQFYLDIHSVEHPAGALRGQFRNEELPVGRSSWARVKGLYR